MAKSNVFEELHQALLEQYPPTPTNRFLYPELYRHLLDEVDTQIKGRREAKFNLREGIRIGDYVRFADGVERRVGYDWGDDIQTTPNGSFHLNEGGGVSCSGSMYMSIPKLSLSLLNEQKDGSFWFFSHDIPGAGRGKDFTMKCKVYSCTLPAPKV